MRTVIGQTFVKSRVELDGGHFEGCIFDRCRLIYFAREPVQLVNCRFINCSWNFEGAAGLTIEFLRALGEGGGVDVLAEVLGEDLVEGLATRERSVPASVGITDAS